MLVLLKGPEAPVEAGSQVNSLACLLYLISFLDRTNIGNAKIAGLQKDLKMTNGQYNAALCIFFVSYSVFEPASNILLMWLRPSFYIPTMLVFPKSFSRRFNGQHNKN
jgi:hypothetical protein